MAWRGMLLWSAVLVAIGCGAIAQPAKATPGAPRPAGEPTTFPVEGYMFLSGKLAADDNGRVYWHQIDAAGDVPPEVRAFIERQASGWVLEDAGGNAVASPGASLSFTLAVRASPAGDGMFGLWLDGVKVEEVVSPAHRVRIDRRVPIPYPRDLARMRAGGIAYVVVWVDADGRVQELFTEQVDLTAVPEDLGQLVQNQARLAAHAAAGIRRWRFRIPDEGPDAGQPFVGRISVDFLTEQTPPAYGRWRYLVRGRRAPPPWSQGAGDALLPAMNGDDLPPAGGRYRIRQTLD